MKVENINNLFTKSNSNAIEKNATEATTFSDFLKNALDEVNELQINSENYTKLLALGEIDNIHDVPIAAEKAKVAFQMTLAIRNKVVDAYKEIMRMQV
ncbi:flagellar hook-basal body complex protein FliE [Proteiniborus sp. MB09-C3]|uniref:flagellar hook-basal body complex protein FliE n=1 Tax=Proteiniborus sp. MB09-C3 TaxID=3050072 RepID=UPI002552BD59|nr:flagellar hook-basal body complex protein FliE [Proteiniborus sp. MB09-C3]WIV10854.1 flagellar hook-basal body complex protein FliE [Proteiniborus sp. MB09-C3]